MVMDRWSFYQVHHIISYDKIYDSFETFLFDFGRSSFISTPDAENEAIHLHDQDSDE